MVRKNANDSEIGSPFEMAMVPSVPSTTRNPTSVIGNRLCRGYWKKTWWVIPAKDPRIIDLESMVIETSEEGRKWAF